MTLFPLWRVSGLVPPTGVFIHTGVTTSLSLLTVIPSSATISASGTQTFIASGRNLDGTTINPLPNVVWVSSDPTIATIDQTTGVATSGLSAGSVTITGTDAVSGVSGTATLTVSAAPSVFTGQLGTLKSVLGKFELGVA